MMRKEDREAKTVIWLQRLREAEAAKEPLVAYARRHGLKRQHIKRIRRGGCQLGLLRAAPLFSRPACEITAVTGE
jgi:hypothetical protein